MGTTVAIPRGSAWDLRRVLFGLFGGLIIASGILFACFTGAGVETSPFNFYSGPSLSSILNLLVSVGLIALGAVVVAQYGSIYGSAADIGADHPASRGEPPRGIRARLAIFLGAFGLGLLLTGLALPISNLGISHGPTPLYISPTVLFVPELVDSVALGVLGVACFLFALDRKQRRYAFRARWHRSGRFVTAAGIAVTLVVARLLVVPVQQSFSTQLRIGGGNSGAIAGEWFPTGIHITVSWSANPREPVNLTIQGTGGVNITFNASSGAFSFVTRGVPWGEYVFLATAPAPETVTINGTFSAPIWPWPPGEPGEPT